MKKVRLDRFYIIAALLCLLAPRSDGSLRLDVKEHDLSNGLKVLILERHRVPISL